MPRVVPRSLITVYPTPSVDKDAPGERAAEAARSREWLDSLAATRSDPYDPKGPFSYFRDLLTIEEARRRTVGTVDEPRFALGDPGPEPGEGAWGPYNSPEDADRRIGRALRDLSSSTGSVPDILRPSMPGRLGQIFGKAARRVSGLVDALERVPLEPGMVDNSGTQLVLKIPALATSSAVATAAENAGVQETDPTSANITSPLGTIAGMVDASRQLYDFSKPGIDDVLSDDLGARLAESLDAQLYNGTGAAGTLKGFLQTSGIISVTGSVTNQAAYLQSLWQAFSQLAGTSGYGSADEANVLTVLHPRRFSWLQAGYSYPVSELVPGRSVLVPNAPANLGAGTSEDHSLVLERSAVTLVGASPTIRVFEQVGSGTLTLRFRAHTDAALLIGNAKAVAKVTGGTPPSGF